MQRPKKNYSEDFKDEVIQYYLNNPSLTYKQIEEKYFVSRCTFYRWAKERDINLKGLDYRPRRYSLNEDCFKQETAEKYYWLGFISADGNVSKDGYCLKIDTDYFDDMQLRLLETALYSRISAGVLPEGAYPITEELVKNSFALTADSQEKMDIIMNDILRGAKIPEENIAVLQQPFAPRMYNTLVVVIIALGLNEDQMKAVQLSAKTAKTGIKITEFTKKATMIASSTANVANRVAKEVLLAGTEIGTTVAVGAVKTGVEMTACALNIGLRDLNPKELAKGENVQSLFKTVKSLWNKNSDNSKITKGFASL